MQVTYDSIAPLVSKSTEQGMALQVTFTCPTSGREVQSAAPLQSAKQAGNFKNIAKRGLMYSMRGALASALRGVLGYGVLGSLGSSLAYSLTSGLGNSNAGGAGKVTEEQKQAATVRAFEAVQGQFCWDSDAESWCLAASDDAMSGFTKQLRDAPITEAKDRQVVARMLVEIANADGNLAEEELAFLSEFITPDLGSVEELSQRPKLTAAELGEASAAGRGTMLMLAMTVAYCDEDLDSREQSRLVELTSGLGVDSGTATTLERNAKHYLIEKALEAGYGAGTRDSSVAEKATEIGGKIGVSAAEVSQIDVTVIKRLGLD